MSITSAKSNITRSINSAKNYLQEKERYLNTPINFPEDLDQMCLTIATEEARLKTIMDRTNSMRSTLDDKYAKLSCMVEDQDSISEYFTNTEEVKNQLEEANLLASELLHKAEAQKQIMDRALNRQQKRERDVEDEANIQRPRDNESVSSQDDRLTRLLENMIAGNTAKKLPDIPLESFSGNAWDFRHFWFGFERVVHNEENLTSQEKLFYLRSVLKKDALRLIGTVPDSENAYEEAIDILKKKYDNPKRVAHQLHEKIRTLTMNDASTSASRDLHERLQQFVPRIKDYGDAVDNRTFLSELLTKFPERIRNKTLDKLVDSNAENPWKWTTVDETLSKVIDREELITGEKEAFRSDTKAVGKQLSTKEMCFLCERSPHRPKDCRSVIPSERRATMRRRNLCFKCGKKHEFRNCSKTCTQCHGPHHAAICGQTDNRQENRNKFPPQGNRFQPQQPRPGYQQSNQNYQQNTGFQPNQNQGYRQQNQGYQQPQNQGYQPRNQGYQQPQGYGNQSRTYQQQRPQNGQTANNSQNQNFNNNRNSGPNSNPRPQATGNGQTGRQGPQAAQQTNAVHEEQIVLNLAPPSLQSNVNQVPGAVVLTGAVPVLAENNILQTETALFDSGSSITFIDQGLIQELKLPIVEYRSMSLQTFGQQSVERDYAFTEFQVLNKDGIATTCRAASVPSRFFGTSTTPEMPIEDRDQIQKLGLRLADSNFDRTIQKFRILFGCDVLWNFMCNTAEASIELPSGMRLIPSSFGYLRSGRAKDSPNNCSFTILETQEPGETRESEQYWMMESLGTKEVTTEYFTEHQEKRFVNGNVQREFEATAQRIDGRYYISFPRRDERMDELSRNERMAFKRLHSLYTTYHDNEFLMEKIQTYFYEQMERGIIEEVPYVEVNNLNHTFYAPFHPVISMEKESSKVRIVFDASAHEKGKMSLNEVLHQGPNYLPQLTGILMRCRTSKILISADVEKAFLMIKLNTPDKDLTRFMLPIDWTKPPSPGNIRHFRHTVLPFGINCSPYLLNAVLQLHRNQGNGGAAFEELEHQMYVDNLFLGASDQDEAMEKIDDSIQFFEEMKMNLRQFQSNDPTIVERLPPERISENDSPKLLGIRWNQDHDTLKFEVDLQYTDSATRRSVSKQISAQYDPLGLIAPVFLKAKIFLQSLFEDKTQHWDRMLSDEQQARWRTVVEDISEATITIPRYLQTNDPFKASTLVIFADASTTAYSACAYVVTGANSHLVMSRTKLASLRGKQTIPKLELEAIALGFRLALHVIPELKRTEYISLYQDVHVLSDSTATIGWLKMDRKTLLSKKLGILVYNRLHEIQRIVSELKCFHTFHVQHVGTHDNPADHGSRGLTPLQMETSNWLRGPEFLTRGIPATWPESEDAFDVRWKEDTKHLNEPATADVVEEQVMSVQPVDAAEDQCIRWTEGVNSQGTPEQPTRLIRLFKAGATILRFLAKCLKNNEALRSRIELTIPELKEVSEKGVLTAGDVTLGENVITRLHQTEAFRRHTVEDMDSIFKARPDEHGLYRLHGRIGRSRLPLETKKPILISGKHPFALLVIEHYHQKTQHYGQEYTLAAIRAKYWVTKPRSKIKQVIHDCRVCRRSNQKPYPYPNACDLPTRRLHATRPFEHIGLDYLGPIMTKEARNDQPSKRWILIVTCLTTRGTYLDLVPDLSTTAFLNALRRFFATYGIPASVTSDNAPQFHLGDRILNSILSTEPDTGLEFQKFLGENQIQWHFISAFAPWQGGCYERICGSVKSAMYKTLRRRIPSFDELQTTLKEITGALNKRPLTYVDNSDDWDVITPGDFLAQGVRVMLPQVVLGGEDEEYLPPTVSVALQTRRDTVAALKLSQDLTKKIWEQFESHYLTNMAAVNRTRHKHHRRQLRVPLVGEIVLVKDVMKPRYAWPLAKILEVLKGTDGLHRNVRIVTCNGRETTRPISLLIPLEMSDDVVSQHESPMPTEVRLARRYNLRARRAREVLRDPDGDGEDYDRWYPEMDQEDGRENAFHVEDHPYEEGNAYPLFVDDDVNTVVPESVWDTTDYTTIHRHERRRATIECSFATDCYDLRPLSKKREKIFFPREANGIEMQQLNANRRELFEEELVTSASYARTQVTPILLPVAPIDNAPPKRESRRKGEKTRLPLWTHMQLIMVIGLALLPFSAALDLACIPGGVSWKGGPGMQQMTICTAETCVETDPNSMFLLLPPSITSDDHVITVKHRDEHQKVQNTELTCPAAPHFCDQILCTFCMDNIANPECHPRSVAIMVIISLYLTMAALLALCTTSCKPASIILGIARLMLWPVVIVGTIALRLINHVRNRNGRLRRRQSTSLVLLRLVSLWMLFAQPVSGCDRVDIIDSEMTRCDGKGHCTVSHIQSINFNPAQPVSCIQAMINGTMAFHARIEWEKAELRCVKSINTFTRSVRHFVASSKRCAHTGSCIPDFCGKVNTDTEIEELGLHNKAPGKTHCVESAGFLGAGCFFPQPGCLFWRETLEPTDDIVYEIFHCTTWAEVATLSIEIMDNANEETFRVPILPGRPKTIGKHRFSVVNMQRNAYPILNSHFIFDGTRTAIMEPQDEIHLWCRSSEEAQKGMCTATPNCQCSPAENTMNCECNPTNLSTILREPSRVLPILQPGLLIRGSNDTVLAEIDSIGQIVVEWNWVMSNLTQTVTETACKAQIGTLQGCYACRQGAKTTATCRAEKSAIASIECGDQTFAIRCGPLEPKTEITVFHSYARVNMECKTSCTPGILELKGTLRFHASPRGFINPAHWTGNEHEITLPDFRHLLSTVAEYIGMRVLFILIIGTIVLGIYMYLKTTTSWRTLIAKKVAPKLHDL